MFTYEHTYYIYIFFSHHVIAIPFELHMCVFWIHMSMYATAIKCSIHLCRYAIYIYIFIYIYKYIYIYIYISVFTHTDTHTYIYIFIFIYAPFHLYTIWTACVLILDTHGYVCTCNDNKLLHSYIWMSVWMSKNIYIYIYTIICINIHIYTSHSISIPFELYLCVY